MLPAILAAVAVGSQVAKGVAKSRLAKRRGKMAQGMLDEAKAKEAQAWGDRKDFAVSSELRDSMAQADTNINSLSNASTAAQAMRDEDNIGVGNVAAQSKRVSGTTGQALSGILAGEKMRQQGYQQAAQQMGQDKLNAEQLRQGLNSQRVYLDNLAYTNNVLTPFSLKYTDAMNMRNNGLAGKISAENMRTEAFGDYMNAIGSAAGAGFEALGGFSSFGGGTSGSGASSKKSSIFFNPSKMTPEQADLYSEYYG